MKSGNLTKETITGVGATSEHPEFGIGDTIEVGLFVAEGNKERVQNFAGDVIAMHKNGVASTFTVRKIGANGIGVERIVPYHSPTISSIKVLKRGDVRRAKLFYVRDRVGKSARIKEKVLTKNQKNTAKNKVEEKSAK